MSEIASYVAHGASQVTPATLDRCVRSLPLWRAEFAQINAPHFPHLVDQLEFLAHCVEDTSDGAYRDLPYSALASAVFALMYAHKKIDILPEGIGKLGHADDSSVVRAVLILHEKAFHAYADKHGVDWERITHRP